MTMFQLQLECEIKHMYFFKGGNKDKEDTDFDEDDFINKPKGFMKKNYIYITNDDKVVIKNLGIRQKSNSEVSRKIFWEKIVPEAKKGKIKFSRTQIEEWIKEYLQKDIMLAAMRKSVGTFKQYEKSSPGSLPAQIAKKYGSGIYFLIPNTRNLGVGKTKQYCDIKEFKDNNCNWTHIDTTGFMREMKYFIKEPKVVKLFDFGI